MSQPNKEDILKAIDKEVKTHPIFMYIKGTKDSPMCGFSAATLKLFKQMGKPFETLDVLSNPDRRMLVPEYSEWPTFPQVFIKGQLIGGSDICHEMYETGELQKLVDEAFQKSS